ncbi:hypothetical protein [Halocatena halophila]|uniref:hypothetical protein n=1 Tax=Halocatena halophila TaxID=2814576 RepID=UPI002ED12F70
MVEKPDVERFEKTVDVKGTETLHVVKSVPDQGTLEWTATWDDNEVSGKSSRLNDNHQALMFSSPVSINGKETHGIALNDAYDRMKAGLKAAKKYRRKKRKLERKKMAKREREKDLSFRITERTRTIGHRTKYEKTETILKPNKKEKHMGDEETIQWKGLRKALGATEDDFAFAGEDTPLDQFDVDTRLTIDELVDIVESNDEIDAIREQRRHKRRREQLIDTYPDLSGIDFDPDRVEDAVDEAEESGNAVSFHKKTVRCNDASLECNLDHLVYQITADGQVDTKRVHTF